MNKFLSDAQAALVCIYERVAAFLKSDVRNVEQRCKTIEEQLRNEIATLNVRISLKEFVGLLP